MFADTKHLCPYREDDIRYPVVICWFDANLFISFDPSIPIRSLQSFTRDIVG